MLLLVVVVLALVLLLVVVDLLGVAVVIVCVVLVLTVVGVVGVLLGAVDVEVLVTDEDLSVVIVGFNLLGSGVFLLGNFGAGEGVVFCVTGAAGLGQRVVFFVGFSVVVVAVVVTGFGLAVGKRVGYGPALGFVFGLFVTRLRSEMKKLNMLSSEDNVVVVVGRAVVAVTIGGKVNRGGFRVGLELDGRESGLITEGGGRGRLSSKSHGRVVLRVVIFGVVVRGAKVAVLFILDEDVPLLGGLTAGGGVGYAGLLNPLVKAVSEAAGE